MDGAVLSIRAKTLFLLLVACVWVSVVSFHVMLTRRQQYRELDNAGLKDRLIFVLRTARERSNTQKEVVNLVAEMYDILENRSPEVVKVTSKMAERNNESTRPPMEFMFITPMEKAWRNTKPLRKDFIIPVHRKLPAEIRPIDSNGNLMYPIINDFEPMDFDDVIAANDLASSVPQGSSLKTSDTPLVGQNIVDDNIIVSNVLKAQADYRAYMSTILARRKSTL